ncbi:biopolymer transporter ExbD [Thalassotalea aquiviva]|uniref:biopolymer transporter ExbD n=1 Tax=Thalassotalea aquiviva TaxID=3242415 RepID=UPI00352BCDE2
MKKPKVSQFEAELDITSFLNLMVVLVPVLLVMMVSSHLSVFNIQLPTSEWSLPPLSIEQQQQPIDLVVREQSIYVFYPQDNLLVEIEKKQHKYDYQTLITTLKSLKVMLLEQGVDKKDIVLSLEPDIDYQTIITLMEKTRSYPAVVAASLVDAELFPNVVLKDAPLLRSVAGPKITAPLGIVHE